MIKSEMEGENAPNPASRPSLSSQLAEQCQKFQMIEASLLVKGSSVVLSKENTSNPPKILCRDVSKAAGKKMSRPPGWDKHGMPQAQHGGD